MCLLQDISLEISHNNGSLMSELSFQQEKRYTKAVFCFVHGLAEMLLIITPWNDTLGITNMQLKYIEPMGN